MESEENSKTEKPVDFFKEKDVFGFEKPAGSHDLENSPASNNSHATVEHPKPPEEDRVKDFFGTFIPRNNYLITPLLIDLNIVLFAIMVFSGANIMLPNTDSLLNWGANFKPYTLDGQWWRLLTNVFLHIGIIHLLMNMYALRYIGMLLEPHLGGTRFTVAYLLTGITASLASLWWHDLTVSAGASGAIFGMYGVFLAMLTTDLIDKSTRKDLLTSIAIFVGYNLLNGLKGGIDNAAHLGGLVGGLIIGYAYVPGLKKPEMTSLKYKTVALLSALILTISVILYLKIPNPIGEYDAKMKSFAPLEDKALKVLDLSNNLPKEKILAAIKDSGIFYWNENLKMLQEIGQLDVPETVHAQNKKLVQYCELRILSYNSIYKKYAEETNAYDTLIDNYNKQIATLISTMK